jgi:hypothetical protein
MGQYARNLLAHHIGWPSVRVCVRLSLACRPFGLGGRRKSRLICFDSLTGF